MDTSSWLQSLIEATHETTTLAPFDNRVVCPFRDSMFYETVCEAESGIDRVKCLNCHSQFYIRIGENSG